MATKKSSLVAEDEEEAKISHENATMVKGARQSTQPPSKHRAEGHIIQEEYGTPHSKASVKAAPFHTSPPPPTRIAAPLILPIPPVFPSTSSERGAAESHLPSSTDSLRTASVDLVSSVVISYRLEIYTGDKIILKTLSFDKESLLTTPETSTH
jgi:hypothetical protein